MSTLYQHLLGNAFHHLAPLVQRFHTEQGIPWRGEAQVIWSKNPVLRLFLKLGRLPLETKRLPVTVCVTDAANGEIWQRRFGEHAMGSKQKMCGQSLQECFWPVALTLETRVDQGVLYQTCPRSRLFDIPLPRPFRFQVAAREWQQDERFNFDVEIIWANWSLIHYIGWLHPQNEEM